MCKAKKKTVTILDGFTAHSLVILNINSKKTANDKDVDKEGQVLKSPTLL